MRLLKYHEKKLLKKVNFFDWAPESNREIAVMRKYHLQRREDYFKYNKLCGFITKLVSLLRTLPVDDTFRIEATHHLIEKLYEMGVTTTRKSLSVCEKIAVSSFCRRRLPVIMVRLRLAQTVKDAVKFIEQGHIRVGTEVVTDPGFHVTRTHEDFVTWTKDSSIRQKVLKYNSKLDDYDLLN